jgi:carboxyl-terminal processing protease
VKKTFSHAVVTLFIVALLIPSLLFAQQKPQGQSSAGGTSAGRTSGGSTATGRRGVRARSGANAIAPIVDNFQEALKLIEDKYVDGRKLDYNSVFKSSITGMLRSLDPHSNYFDREEFDEMKTDQRSEYFGIGASIQNYSIGDNADTFITATFDNSPAARAGLRFGDRILEVDGAKMTGKPSIEVRDKIRGPRGSAVKITVERAADKRIETVEITREAVPQPSIPDAYMLKPGVGYIDMSRGFNYSTTEELGAALEELHGRGMTSLVLDLRSNPGGFLDQAINVAQKFLPSGEVILTQKGRNGVRDNTYRSNNDSPDLTPLVILINGSTASASEIVAGAMQDHDRALIVGTTSFGKGLVQSIIPLEYGAGLTLTSAKYYTPSGRLIQRDYSNGGLYDYYTRGGSNRLDQKDQSSKPNGPEKRTDTGRTVYGGGGISPDEPVEPRTASLFQLRLVSPIFAFSREVVNGRIAGFESYRVPGPINFGHELQPTDFPFTDSLFAAFKHYVASQSNLKMTAAQLDRNRSFIGLQLRFNLTTAAYGRVMAERVLITTDDPQFAKAVDILPRARDLAMTSMRAHSQP